MVNYPFLWERIVCSTLLLWPPCRCGSHTCDAPEINLAPTSTMSIEDAPFCGFCFASDYPTTRCPGFPPHICAALVNTRDANLSNIARHPQWYSSKPNCGRSPPKYGSTLTSQRFVSTSNKPHPPQGRSPPLNTNGANASATLLLLKI